MQFFKRVRAIYIQITQQNYNKNQKKYSSLLFCLLLSIFIFIPSFLSLFHKTWTRNQRMLVTMRFSVRRLTLTLFSAVCCSVAWLKFTDVSEKRATPIFEVERYAYSSILKMEAACSSETPSNTNETTRSHTPDDRGL
jgi:hypothetical protein